MNCISKKIITACTLLSCSLTLYAQANSFSLDTCYTLAQKNYPLIKQFDLIAKAREYSIENITKGYLPQININGQASYQSDITQLPKGIPGVPVLTKDQYKLYAEINQPIYDGGVIRAQKEIEEAGSAVDEQKLKVELYQLKDRINQLFFGILLIDEQLKQQALMVNDIQIGLDKINAQIANGTALRSNADILKAELLKAGQQSIELKTNKKAFTDMLGLFIHQSLDENTFFIRPPDITASAEIKRPELQMYDFQKKIFDAQSRLLTAKNNLKISFFVQGGWGKPAFNILSNNFDPFYIGGLRLTFPISGFYTLKNEKSLLDINKKNVEVQRETFLFNTQLSLSRQSADIIKLHQFLKTDDEIISLRMNVKKAALAQLENGVINSSDYLRELNAENSARQNKILHETQLLMAQYNERNTAGE